MPAKTVIVAGDVMTKKEVVLAIIIVDVDSLLKWIY